MTDKHLEAYIKRLEELKSEGRLRRIPPHRTAKQLIDLCSNDYMGLAKNCKDERQTFAGMLDNIQMTSSASRLLSSEQDEFSKLEQYLEEHYNNSAVLFNSGYHANVGLTTALNLPGTLWLIDKLIHASVIDGLRMANAEFKRWRHNDIEHLRKILHLQEGKYERIIVVCESVYSMDGDIAPLREISELKNEFPDIMLYVDEAHAIGAFGPSGLGLCKQYGITDKIDIIVGTLGKACASSGAFCVTTPMLKEFIINSARSLIFSTALAPANARWSLLMLEKLRKMNKEREHLARIAEKFRKGIEMLTGEENPSRSAIVPLITGNAAKAVSISQELEKEGILALPIRRPTVPPGGERIRFSLNASLTESDIELILNKISRVYQR